jgi:hypothetical protein
MTAPTLGPISVRDAPSSDLLHWWNAADGTVDARTGQKGNFFSTYSITDVPGLIVGRNGATVQAGHNQPRFIQDLTQGDVTRLELVGDVGGQDVERIEWPNWGRGIIPISYLIKAWPLYAPGATLGAGNRQLLSLGNADTGGGSLSVYRAGNQWVARRGRPGSSWTSALVEPGTAVFPLLVLVTLTILGTLQISIRDSAATPVTTVAASITDINMMLAGERWAGDILYSSGGAYRLEEIKIAENVHTFTSLGALR